jgi:hypothetical protein
MKKLKHIVSLTLAMVMLAVTSGYSFHSIKCQMTGEEYNSVIKETKSCCCDTPQQDESKKCCTEKSTLVKLETEYASQQVAPEINPVFVAAFISHFVLFSITQSSIDANLNYLTQSPPLPDREIIILVQSFLL